MIWATESHYPTHSDQAAKVVAQCPIGCVKRAAGSDAAPIETEVPHSGTVVATTEGPHPPRFVVDQAQSCHAREGRKEKHGEELVQECGDEHEQEDLKSLGDEDPLS